MGADVPRDDEAAAAVAAPAVAALLRKTAKGFEIVHYQLSVAVPNEIVNQVTGLIKAAEAGAAGAK